MSTEGRSPLEMTQFGVFYPRGYIVAAFGSREHADRVRRDLLTGGYEEQDCLADKGATFLLIHAPDDLEADRAMNVVRRVPFEFAHRHHRLAIQVLK